MSLCDDMWAQLIVPSSAPDASSRVARFHCSGYRTGVPRLDGFVTHICCIGQWGLREMTALRAKNRDEIESTIEAIWRDAEQRYQLTRERLERSPRTKKDGTEALQAWVDETH